MIELMDIRYVRLGTTDLAKATRFATEIVGLQIADRKDGQVYFKSDDRDHTLVYFEEENPSHATGFELRSGDAMQDAAKQLADQGIAVTPFTADQSAARRVMDGISFDDPSGNRIELVIRPFHSGVRYFPSRDAGITGFSHIGLRSTDPTRDEVFWTEVLNARVSDWIGKTPLLRIDEVHHKIALFPSSYPGVQHINHQVESIDDIMRAAHFLQENQVKIVFGPGRHPTSTAMFLYFEGPDGMVYEYSSGVRKITDEATYRPRQFPFEPSSFCMWGTKPDIPEFK